MTGNLLSRIDITKDSDYESDSPILLPQKKISRRGLLKSTAVIAALAAVPALGVMSGCATPRTPDLPKFPQRPKIKKPPKSLEAYTNLKKCSGARLEREGRNIRQFIDQKLAPLQKETRSVLSSFKKNYPDSASEASCAGFLGHLNVQRGERSVLKRIMNPHGDPNAYAAALSKEMKTVYASNDIRVVKNDKGVAVKLDWDHLSKIAALYEELDEDEETYLTFLLYTSRYKKQILEKYNSPSYKKRRIMPGLNTHIVRLEEDKIDFDNYMTGCNITIADFLKAQRNRDKIGHRLPKENPNINEILGREGHQILDEQDFSVKVDGKEMKIPKHISVADLIIPGGSEVSWEDLRAIDFLGSTMKSTDRVMSLFEMITDGRFGLYRALEVR